MNAWTKEDVVTVVARMKTTRVFYHNEMLFIRPDKTSDDEMHLDLHDAAASGGGAVALRVNIDYLNEVEAAGVSAIAGEVIAGIPDNGKPLDSIIIIDNVFNLGSDVVQFVIAHELGHIVNRHTAIEGVEGIEANQPNELVADTYAIELLGNMIGFNSFLRFMSGKISTTTLALEIINPVITSLRGRAKAILPSGDYHEEDYQLRIA